MSVVILEHASRKVGCHIGRGGRVLVGRLSFCDLSLNHPDVSPIHIWIGNDEQGPFFVNLQTLTSDPAYPKVTRRPLTDSDVLSVGPARLRLCSGDVPPGVRLISRRGMAMTNDVILFDCLCGAPMFASKDKAGRVGRCRFCQRRIIVPQSTGATAFELNPTRAPGAQNAAVCGVCQWPVDPETESTTCPECGVSFHPECWKENNGCCSYGCSQVGCLAKSTPPEPHTPPQSMPEVPQERLAWALPVISVAVVVVGLPLFGVPALVLNLLVLRGLRAGKGGRGGLIAAVICIAGILAGIVVSYSIWIAGSPRSAPGRI